MNIFEFIDNFKSQDLFDRDKRIILEKINVYLARIVFEGLLKEDFSEIVDHVNYYELTKEILNTPTDVMETL